MLVGGWLLVGCAGKSPPLRIVDSTAPLADLSGAWEIDYQLTESAEDKLRYLYDLARSQFERQEKMQSDREAGSPRAYKAYQDLQGIIKLGTLAEEMTRATVLAIAQDDGFISIKRSDDYSLTCDFEAPVHTLKIGQESCGIDGQGRLTFQARLPEGLTVIHRYSMSEGIRSDEDKRLYVSTILISDKFSEPFSLNRVYMLYPPGEGMYQCEFTLEKKKSCWLGKRSDE